MGKSGGKIKETELEKANSQVAMEQWEEYKTTYRPTELKFIASVMKDETGLKERAAGRVNADIAQKTALPLKGTGVDPSRAATSSIFSDIAGVEGTAQALAKQRTDDRRVTGMQAITDIGQGKAATAQQGFSALAGQSVSEAISRASANQQKNDSYASAVMTALGGGARATQGLWGAPTGGPGVAEAAADDMYNTVNPVARYEEQPFSALPVTKYGPRR